jgi:hypothetical protein
MSSYDLEKKKRSPSSSDHEVANNGQVDYIEPQETLHRALKARQVSRSYSFHSLDLHIK